MHVILAQQIAKLLQLTPGADRIEEIRILNDGGGTGTWHIAIQLRGVRGQQLRVVGLNVSMEAPYSKPERVPADLYCDLANDRKTFA